MRIEPVQMVVLQSTTVCNLNCDYCYLSEASRRSKRSLSLDALTRIFTNIFSSRFMADRMVVCWHSGEPLALQPTYYDEAIELITALAHQYCPADFSLRFDMQTNGTLIDDAWCAFFSRHRDRFDLGVSCDGPAFLHDAHRRNWSGKPTHDSVVRGLNRLCAAAIPFNIIAVIPPDALDYADELFDFVYEYRDHLTDFHFNFMDAPTASVAQFDVDLCERNRYYFFLRKLLARSAAARDSARPFTIRNFSHMYNKLFGSEDVQGRLSARSMSSPFKTLNIEANGAVTTFYAGITSQEHKHLYGDGAGLVIGNILTQSLDDIANSQKLRRIADDFELSHRTCEVSCIHFGQCSGGFNLTKYARFGRFDSTETPECLIHTKTVLLAVMDDLQDFLDRQNSLDSEAVRR
jgi:uncharacterized protein